MAPVTAASTPSRRAAVVRSPASRSRRLSRSCARPRPYGHALAAGGDRSAGRGDCGGRWPAATGRDSRGTLRGRGCSAPLPRAASKRRGRGAQKARGAAGDGPVGQWASGPVGRGVGKWDLEEGLALGGVGGALHRRLQRRNQPRPRLAVPAHPQLPSRRPAAPPSTRPIPRSSPPLRVPATRNAPRAAHTRGDTSAGRRDLAQGEVVEVDQRSHAPLLAVAVPPRRRRRRLPHRVEYPPLLRRPPDPQPARQVRRGERRERRAADAPRDEARGELRQPEPLNEEAHLPPRGARSARH